MSDTRERLLEAAADLVRHQGVVAATARAIAGRAEVNQALVFYHFGTVGELIELSSRRAVDEAVERHREALRAVTSLSELLATGRELHEGERALGNVAMMGQLMGNASRDESVARAARYAMTTWAAELEDVVARVVGDGPLSHVVDAGDLSGAIAASFIGLELYDGVDHEGASAGFAALEKLGALVDLVNDLGPVARSAPTSRKLGGSRPASTGST